MRDHLSMRQEYFDLEKERQRLANVDRLDIEKFKSLYGEKMPELIPYDLIHSSFYTGAKNLQQVSDDAKPGWRLKTVLDSINITDGSLLDAGCGWSGRLLEAVGERFSKINLYGLDQFLPSDYRGPGTYVCSDISKTTIFSDEQFDIVVSMEMLEHIPPTRTLLAWGEMNRVLKKGGRIIITTPYTENLMKFTMFCPVCQRWVAESGHVRENPPSVVTAEMVVSGFKPVARYALDDSVRAYIGEKL